MMNKCGICGCRIIAQEHRIVCYSCELDQINPVPGVEDFDQRRWFLDGF